MGIVTPAPSVFGSISLTAAVETICLGHLFICLVLISLPNSMASISMAGVMVSPLVQCAMGAFGLIGIPFIIVGGVGAVYRVEGHLKAYLAYLIAFLIVSILWFFVFLEYGSACTTVNPNSSGNASFVCGVSNGMVVFWALVAIGFTIFAIYITWSMAKYVKLRLESELLHYQEPWAAAAQLADDLAAEESRQRSSMGSLVPGVAAMPESWAMAPPASKLNMGEEPRMATAVARVLVPVP
mmetsp:Transcript_32774/g.59917  ORF Transcript_32774/g.59917 Transcript_32774/m.59917 type:complete len:240 (+) Transcript_32774:102-821(+)